MPEAERVERAVEKYAQPPVPVEEEQQPERDERRPARDPDQAVVVAEPAERAHGLREGDPGEHEGDRRFPPSTATRSTEPRKTVLELLASTSTEARTMPMHGAAQTANAAPSRRASRAARALEQARCDDALRPRQEADEGQAEDDEHEAGDLVASAG